MVGVDIDEVVHEYCVCDDVYLKYLGRNYEKVVYIENVSALIDRKFPNFSELSDDEKDVLRPQIDAYICGIQDCMSYLSLTNNDYGGCPDDDY